MEILKAHFMTTLCLIHMGNEIIIRGQFINLTLEIIVKEATGFKPNRVSLSFSLFPLRKGKSDNNHKVVVQINNQNTGNNRN